MEEYPLIQHYMEMPVDKEDAYDQWKGLKKAIELLQVTHEFDDDHLENILKLADKAIK